MTVKQDGSKISQKGYDAEIFAEEFLQSQGYEILYNPTRIRRGKAILGNVQKKIELARSIIGNSVIPKNKKERLQTIINEAKSFDEKHHTNFAKSVSNLNQITFVDLLCKKGTDYYVFDIKHKTFKENINLNQFYVTNYEVLNYDKISKENKVKLKIMVIFEKDEKLFYRIYDWSDFKVPSSFNPHTMPKTSVRLREGFDISKLIEI